MSAVPHVIFRRTRKLLRELSEEGPDLWKKTWPSEAARLLPYFTERRKNEKQRTTAKDKAGGAQAARATSKAIRAAVMKRAHWLCEGRGCVTSQPLQLDHWLSGSGRRKVRESVKTCWALCWLCHRSRTRNDPSAAYWNARFKSHCDYYGYPFTPHVEHAQLPGRAAR